MEQLIENFNNANIINPINETNLKSMNNKTLFEVCYKYIKNKNFYSKLDLDLLNIYEHNLNTIHKVIIEYEKKESEERKQIQDSNAKYNKMLYEPIINKNKELRNILNEIENITNLRNSMKKHPNYDKDIFTDLCFQIKNLTNDSNYIKKMINNMECQYSYDRKNTNIPFGDFTICCDRLNIAMKCITKCKEKIYKNYA